MNSMLEYIDDYFTGQLPAEEKERFAKRCEQDNSFAQEVANYISVRKAVKAQLLENLQSRSQGGLTVARNNDVKKKSLVVRMMPYVSAVAACLVLYLGWVFLFKPTDTTKLADNYIQSNFQQLSVTMSDRQDSLQLGIAAFNRKEYEKASRVFGDLAQRDPANTEVIKNIGILYLVEGKYDSAVHQFDKLSRLEELYYNPGPLYKAISLMKRSAPGDKEAARKILENIQAKKGYGSQEAETWLKEL